MVSSNHLLKIANINMNHGL